MRVMVHEYAEDGRNAFEISDDGAEFERQLAGSWQVGKRICAFIDVGCDNNEKGIERLLDTLAWLTEEIKKRKANPVSV